MLSRLPRQIMRIERDAMSADSRTRIERHETERLRRRRANDFPGVDIQRVTKAGHLVCHADVYRAKSIFQQLRGLGHTRGSYGMNVVDDVRIKMCGNDRRIGCDPADDLRNVMRHELRISGIDALRREREQKILVEFQTRLFKHRQQHFVGGAGISRRFQNDQLPAAQAFLNLFGSRENVGNVRLLRFPKGRRNANDDGVTFSQVIEIGGGTQPSGEVAAHLYSQIVRDVHAVSSARVAEAAKLLENTFRAVNIGMANEMARLCYALNIDTWEVIRAAATKPFGFMPFYPGPGIGGHCIPLDPHYLSWKARQHGFDSRFISLAEEVNSRMPEHVVQLVADGLNDERKAMKGSQILLLGVAYKKDVDDVRESPALSIIDRLRAKGANVSYHDPFVAEMSFEDAHTEGNGEPLSSVSLSDEQLKAADCVIIVTDHSGIDYQRVCSLAPLIVDTRNALNGDVRRDSKARIIRL